MVRAVVYVVCSLARGRLRRGGVAGRCRASSPTGHAEISAPGAKAMCAAGEITLPTMQGKHSAERGRAYKLFAGADARHRPGNPAAAGTPPERSRPFPANQDCPAGRYFAPARAFARPETRRFFVLLPKNLQLCVKIVIISKNKCESSVIMANRYHLHLAPARRILKLTSRDPEPAKKGGSCDESS